MNTVPLSLYIHIPWCLKKCPYCDFNSHASSQELPEQEYITKLLIDLNEHHAHFQNRPIQSIFIGGGTPSLFSGDSFKKILNHIAENFPLTKHAEITLEANPGATELTRFQTFREAGINRLSLGIQSWNNQKLQLLGRIHDGDQARKAVLAAKQAGFLNFNLDIMHGLPGQTVDEAIKDIEECLVYQPTHISWYQLTIEPNTYFHQFPPQLPVDDLLWDIQQAGESCLAAAGFKQYEISAYCREDNYSRHNMNYWQFGDYIGIGAGAHSKITLEDGAIWRFWKVKNPKDYLSPTSSLIAGKRQITHSELPLEYMMNAMRLYQDIALSSFYERTGLTWQDIEKPLNQAEQSGFVEIKNQTISVTGLGKRFLNDLLALFMPVSTQKSHID